MAKDKPIKIENYKYIVGGNDSTECYLMKTLVEAEEEAIRYLNDGNIEGLTESFIIEIKTGKVTKFKNKIVQEQVKMK